MKRHISRFALSSTFISNPLLAPHNCLEIASLSSFANNTLWPWLLHIAYLFFCSQPVITRDAWGFVGVYNVNDKIQIVSQLISLVFHIFIFVSLKTLTKKRPLSIGLQFHILFVCSFRYSAKHQEAMLQFSKGIGKLRKRSSLEKTTETVAMELIKNKSTKCEMNIPLFITSWLRTQYRHQREIQANGEEISIGPSPWKLKF